jgi:stalled ribosome rescue protein Dom34
MISTEMISTAIWISSNEARIFRFTPGGVDFHHLHAHGAKVIDEHESPKFFAEVTELMKRHDDRIVLFGPGLAKVHFKTYFEKHLPHRSQRIIETHSTDHLTDAQIVAFAHRCFKSADVFE